MTITNDTVSIPANLPQPARRESWLARGLPALIIVAVGLFLYTLNRFSQFQTDDVNLINQLRYDKGSLGATWPFFTGDWQLDGTAYAPLSRLLFLVEFQLFKAVPGGWHVISSLLHVSCAVLVWLLCLLLTRRPGMALIAGLLFAVLPVHVPVVVQISSQAEMLATLFCLVAVCAYIYQRRYAHTSTQRRLALALAVVSFGLGLLSKQQAIALPLALLGYELVTRAATNVLHPTHDDDAHHDVPTERAETSLLAVFIPFLGLVLIYLIIQNVFMGGLGAFISPQVAPGGVNDARSLGDFLRGNVRLLSDPFGLSGADGLILVIALGAFLLLSILQDNELLLMEQKFSPLRTTSPDKDTALTITEEPRAQANGLFEFEEDEELDSPPMTPPPPINQPAVVSPAIALNRRPLNDDDEMDALVSQPAASVSAVPATPALPANLPAEAVSTAVATPELEVASPLSKVALENSYTTTRAAVYGVLWAGVFILPFVLQIPNARNLYPVSVGFALFMAACLAPYGAANVANPRLKPFSTLFFGYRELSYWLRLGAVITLFYLYFATAVTRIDELIKASKPLASVLSLWFT